MSASQRLPGANVNFISGRNNLKICNIKCQANEEVQAVVLGLISTRESRRNSLKLVECIRH
jgi:hypothetical protein